MNGQEFIWTWTSEANHTLDASRCAFIAFGRAQQEDYPQTEQGLWELCGDKAVSHKAGSNYDLKA